MPHRLVRTAVMAAVGLLALQGCGESRHNSASQPPAEAIVRSAEPSATNGEGTSDKGGMAATGIATTSLGLNRKIIYSANVELAVESFGGVPDQVVAIVKRLDAYVADSNLSGSAGASRHGTWKIRVPVARFEEFVNAAKGLGELTSARTHRIAGYQRRVLRR
jgi:hypothetical protein